MTRLRLAIVIGLTCAVWAACSERETIAAPTPPRFVPTEAQPRLETMKVFVGPRELTAEIAQRPREIATGMMFRTNVTDGDAMLFVLPAPHQAGFWMKNCPEPLSCAYINPSGIIEEIHAMEPHNTNAIMAGSSNILFVLETQAGWFDRNKVEVGTLVETERGSLLETFFRTRSR